MLYLYPKSVQATSHGRQLEDLPIASSVPAAPRKNVSSETHYLISEARGSTLLPLTLSSELDAPGNMAVFVLWCGFRAEEKASVSELSNFSDAWCYRTENKPLT